MNKYEEISEAIDRINYAVYKHQHDKLDKMFFENFTNEKWNNPLPTYDELK